MKIRIKQVKVSVAADITGNVLNRVKVYGAPTEDIIEAESLEAVRDDLRRKLCEIDFDYEQV
jgi:hypothetical protein